MVDSTFVLYGQALAYIFYCIVILLLMEWFALKVVKPGKNSGGKPALFYTFVGFLPIFGVSLHIITFNTIPWTPMDLNRSEIKADQIFNISIENH